MPVSLDVRFVPLAAALQPVAVLIAGREGQLSGHAASLDERAGGALRQAAAAAEFNGRAKSTLEVLAPPKIGARRVLLLGIGDAPGHTARLNLGGVAQAAIAARKTPTASLVAEAQGVAGAAAIEFAVDLAMGALLRSYSFKTYRTRRGGGAADDANGNGGDDTDGLKTLFVHCVRPDEAADAFARAAAVARGVALARDLVNEPANVLGPVEFAGRIEALREAGVEVEILDVEAMTRLKMGALLGVAQGSARPARLAVVQWHGAKSKRARPICFVGKGVTFDTGGVSIKPAAGMEDMKGDMGGAAAVTGLILALAGRKAPVNAVGLVGLVENMLSGTAQRPGDIVTSMSGQTIEIINTDAEGRLVLADVLWYAQERFNPRLIVDLATLTGAMLVALGKEYAGMFSNNDKLSAELEAAGEATGEKVWRLPLAKAYDKLIDSRFADMKNTGGRLAGSITAAQFLQRFIKDTPWVHIDVAGTAMDSPKTDINPSWGGGWGVRLLDRLVADHYERGER
jgi:leucyl aminopeptidase